MRPKNRGSWKGWVELTDDDDARLAETRRENGFIDGSPREPGDANLNMSTTNVASASTATTTGPSAPANTTDATPAAAHANSTVEGGDEDQSAGADDAADPDDEVPALPMMHYSKMKWTNFQGTVPQFWAAFIDPYKNQDNADVYLQGGQVHRVHLATIGKDIDVMICDPSFCILCCDDEDIDDVDDQQESKTDGHPFVHSTDTTRGPASEDDARIITTFTPTPKPHGELKEGYARNVFFKTSEGMVSVLARVCGYAGCKVCQQRVD